MIHFIYHALDRGGGNIRTPEDLGPLTGQLKSRTEMILALAGIGTMQQAEERIHVSKEAQSTLKEIY